MLLQGGDVGGGTRFELNKEMGVTLLLYLFC